MAQIFVPGAGEIGDGGVARIAQDPGTLGTVYEFPYESVSLTDTDNNGYIDVIDSQAYQFIRSSGAAVGAMTFNGVLTPDRGMAAMLTLMFGSAGRKQPWVVNWTPYAGGSVYKATGLFFNRFSLTGRFGTRGDDLVMRFSLSALVMDPRNTLSAPTLSAPGTEGLPGDGPSSFDNFTLTDGQVSPTSYTDIIEVAFGLDNRMVLKKSFKSTTNRVLSGCTPGPIAGGLSIRQPVGAGTLAPRTGGTYPLQLVIPTGSLAHTMTIDASMSWDTKRRNGSPVDIVDELASYTLFATSTGATASGSWPVIFGYS